MVSASHVPPEVLEAVAGAGVPEDGLLVDKDHLSHDLDKSTEAYGWVRELAVCEGDLAARIEWTPLGRPLVEGKDEMFTFHMESNAVGSERKGDLPYAHQKKRAKHQAPDAAP